MEAIELKKRVERDRVLGHEDEADGIQEYDNPLPDWWLGLFWITIIWAVGYLVYYHFIAHMSPQVALAQELTQAEERWPQEAEAEAELTVPLTAEAVAAGEQIFKTNCTACHGADMRGGIGPSLLDDEWLHGGSEREILTTITDGVISKGMISWGPILGPEAVREVAAYVITKNAEALGREPGAGPPEGP